ncbi:SufE family protein [Pseudomonas sp. KSR10]|jgi:cysteine desulfuration protein SufE|uniref:Fe-S metabolism protein SufE n=1 Tax=Stutzerimonas stutzeri TaxID=316 RepID=A0A0D9AJH3_STUST|nr:MULTISPECIES: SufE family protein [Pseudomonadaceae]KJH80824.1 Fe-S metabolism protein SufE [Stutzerimonas stutzeri]MCG6539159.1 SufE family protein [Pseudomonas sp. KSR10]
MSELSIAATGALQSFQQAAGWEQRARLLMQWGDRLEPLSDTERTDDNLVTGCDSKLWLLGEPRGDHWHFRGTSEARLLRGLLAVLLLRANGLRASELQRLDIADWFGQLGLSRQLSPSRANGMNAVLQRMRELASSG